MMIEVTAEGALETYRHLPELLMPLSRRERQLLFLRGLGYSQKQINSVFGWAPTTYARCNSTIRAKGWLVDLVSCMRYVEYGKITWTYDHHAFR